MACMSPLNWISCSRFFLKLVIKKKKKEQTKRKENERVVMKRGRWWTQMACDHSLHSRNFLIVKLAIKKLAIKKKQ